MTDTLTEKQRRFVEAFMGEACGNATEAARRAGYKGNDVTLASVGRENLGKPQITAAIAQRQEADPAVATRQERQAFWTRAMRGEATFVIDGKERTVPVAMKDRLKASELLGKTGGDFIDRQEGNLTIRVVRG